MKVEFGYGKGTRTVDIPEKNLIGVLRANEMQHVRTGVTAVRYALKHPIGAARLHKLVSPGMKIAIVTSDVSRPMPSALVLPEILDELFRAKIPKEDITVVFAIGSHRKETEEEMRRLVGDRVFDTVKCVDSDPDDVVRLGVTERGTPVDMTRTVAEADFVIGVGNIEFHYFAGYSGGAKALMPGVSTREAIQANHRMMVLDDACAGKLHGNPLREDIEEAGEIARLSYIVNVVLDEHKQIVYAVAGDKIEAHRDGCAYLDRMYRVKVPCKAEIVVVSQGGAPKDLNLYQTHKALENAKYVVQDGGTIILIGACPEGVGSAVFEEWLLKADDPDATIESIRQKFVLGGHKAAAIAMIRKRAKIVLVSEIDPEYVKKLHFVPASSAEEAFREAMDEYGPEAKVLAMPYGGTTFPQAE